MTFWVKSCTESPARKRQISERLGEGPQKEMAQSTAARSAPLAPPGRSHSSSRGHGGDSSTRAEIKDLPFFTEKTKQALRVFHIENFGKCINIA